MQCSSFMRPKKAINYSDSFLHQCGLPDYTLDIKGQSRVKAGAKMIRRYSSGVIASTCAVLEVLHGTCLNNPGCHLGGGVKAC